MKKVLSFALVLAMILGSVSMAFAAKSGYPDTKGIDAEEAINVLTGLGVIEGYDDGTFKPEKSVTRAEMVKMIIAALNMPVKEGVYNTQFVDVAPTAWYSAYVSYGVTLGIIEGKSATIFDPNGVVTYDQAITMTMRALGYTEAALNGVYPACFVSKAVSLGAMKNLHSGSGDANRADCAQLIFNVLQSPIGKVGNNNIWVAYGLGEDGTGAYDTMLIRLGAHLVGTVKGCDVPDGYNYKKTEKVDNKTVEIEDGQVVTMELCEAEDTLIDMKPLLGHLVTYYHNDDEEVVAVAEVKTTEVTGKVKTDKIGDVKFTNDYDGFDKDTMKYFYNGYEVAEKPNVDETAVAFTYTVMMKGGKISDVVSMLVWEVTEDKMVKADDLKTMFDEDDLSLLDVEFKTVEDEDEIDMNSFILEGVDSLEDIAKDNVVYVYAGDKDNHITKIQVGTKTVAGVIDEVTSTGKKVTVEDEVYNIHDQITLKNAIAAEDVKNWYQAGEEATLYLDVNGKFYDVKNAEDPKTGYVVVLKTQVANEDDTTGWDDSIDGSLINKISVFNEDGEAKTYRVDAEKVNKKVADDQKALNEAAEKKGDNVEPEQTAYLTWAEEENDLNADIRGGRGQVVILTLDKNEKVIAIKGVDMVSCVEAPEEDAEEDAEAPVVEINKKGVVDVEKAYVLKDEKAVVFAAEKTTEAKMMKASNWSVVKASSIWNKEVPYLYVDEEDAKGIVKVAVVSGANTNDGDTVYGVIKSYSEIKDYAKIAALINGEATTVKMDDDEAKNETRVTAPGKTIYAIKLDGNEVVSVSDFAPDYNKTFAQNVTVLTTAAIVDDLNRLWVEENGANVWYALDDEAVVYVYDKSDDAWTIKTIKALNGLKLTKTEAAKKGAQIEVKLFDTNDKDKEYYNVVVVVRP